MRTINLLAPLLALGLLAPGCDSQGDKADNKADTKKDDAQAKAGDKAKADDKKADGEAKAKTPEEEKAEKIAKNKERLAKVEATAAEEAKRWDDALKAEAKALVEANHKDVKSALAAALAGKHRTPGNSDRDAFRHPVETLEFFGLQPNSQVIEYGSGAGWYTEVLAPVLAKAGKLTVTGADPNGPIEEGSTIYGKRTELFLAKSPELFGKVETKIQKGDTPDLGDDGSADLVIAFREMHGWYGRDAFDKNVAAVFKVLKPGGVFGVVQHRANDGEDPKATSEKGRLPEDWVIKQVEAAGFKLEAKSDINANPKDTKDQPGGVWDLPPSLSGDEKDKEKYAAVGESDRMTLKFVKPAS